MQEMRVVRNDLRLDSDKYIIFNNTIFLRLTIL